MNELKKVPPFNGKIVLSSQLALELRQLLNGRHKVKYIFDKGDPHEPIISALRLSCDMKKEA